MRKALRHNFRDCLCLTALPALPFFPVIRCGSACGINLDRESFDIVESIPMGVTLSPVRQSTYDAWMNLITNAKDTLNIAAFYMTLTDGAAKGYPGSAPGKDVYDAIVDASHRGVQVSLVLVSTFVSP